MSYNKYLDDILLFIGGIFFVYFGHVILDEYKYDKYFKTWNGIGLYSLFIIIILFIIYIGQLIYYKGNIPPNKPYRRRRRRVQLPDFINFIIEILLISLIIIYLLTLIFNYNYIYPKV